MDKEDEMSQEEAKNRIVYPLRYFGSTEDSRISAKKEIWIEDKTYHLKYLCRECGYRFHLAIPILEIQEIADPECPVAIIYPSDQNCDHIFGYNWDKKELVIPKYAVLSDIITIGEKSK